MDSDCRQKSSAPTVLKCYRNGLQQSGAGEKAEAEACEGECKSLRGRHQRRRIGSGYVVVIVLRDRHGNHDTDQFLQIGAVTIGAAAILKTSPWLYHTLRVAGGGYLVWLGIQRIRTEPGTGSEPSAVPRHVMSSSALGAHRGSESEIRAVLFIVPAPVRRYDDIARRRLAIVATGRQRKSVVLARRSYLHCTRTSATRAGCGGRHCIDNRPLCCGRIIHHPWPCRDPR